MPHIQHFLPQGTRTNPHTKTKRHTMSELLLQPVSSVLFFPYFFSVHFSRLGGTEWFLHNLHTLSVTSFMNSWFKRDGNKLFKRTNFKPRKKKKKCECKHNYYFKSKNGMWKSILPQPLQFLLFLPLISTFLAIILNYFELRNFFLFSKPCNRREVHLPWLRNNSYKHLTSLAIQHLLQL